MPTNEELVAQVAAKVERRKAAYKKRLAEKGASDPSVRAARKLLKRAQRLRRRLSPKPPPEKPPA